MKKMFVAVFLVSIAACASKKPAVAPQDKAPIESKDDATGGARYGGNIQPINDTPEPSAPR